MEDPGRGWEYASFLGTVPFEKDNFNIYVILAHEFSIITGTWCNIIKPVYMCITTSFRVSHSERRFADPIPWNSMFLVSGCKDNRWFSMHLMPLL